MIAIAQVIEAHAEVQDALVQEAVFVRLGPPHQFERLVLLEELAGVELVDGLEQLGWRRLRAAEPRIATAQALQRRLHFDVLQDAAGSLLAHGRIVAARVHPSGPLIYCRFGPAGRLGPTPTSEEAMEVASVGELLRSI